MLEHGGNLDLALQRFGGRLDDWIDLSTGINRRPYPLPKLEPRHWGALPSRSEIEALHEAGREAYGTRAPIVALAGALGVRLSGPRVYHGSVADEPWLNGAARDPLAADIAGGLAIYVRAMTVLAGCLAFLSFM